MAGHQKPRGLWCILVPVGVRGSDDRQSLQALPSSSRIVRTEGDMPKTPRRRPARARGSTVAVGPARIEIDFVILADFAQAVQGKLSLIGGGWNLHHPRQYPSALPFGLGIGILVPWSETNRRHAFKFIIRKSEGPQLIAGEGEFEVGRDVGTPPGMTQRATLGIAGQLNLPEPGTYEVIVTAGGGEKRVIFEALPVQPRPLI